MKWRALVETTKNSKDAKAQNNDHLLYDYRLTSARRRNDRAGTELRVLLIKQSCYRSNSSIAKLLSLRGIDPRPLES